MKIKLNLFLIIAILATSCGNKRSANDLLLEFIAKNVPDQREIVFNVEIKNQGGEQILFGETDSELLKNKLLSEFDSFRIKDNITILPDSTVGNKPFGLINLSVANLRASPSHSAELVSQGLMGKPVKILKKEKNWFLIQTPDKYISWIEEDGLSPKTEQEWNLWRNSTRVFITSELEFVRNNYEKKSEIISDLVMGNILEVSALTGNYFKVILPDGRTGFIPQNCCIDFDTFKKETSPEIKSMIKLVKSFMGRPYLWGGTSSRAMDCSGFIKTIYYMHGLVLARDASLQTKYGGLIKPSENLNNFKPGDLLFFGSDSSHVTHVAFSLGGDEFIHDSGMVKENSFNPESGNYSEYRKNSFIRCRRIIGSEGTEGILWIKEHPWY